MKINFMHLMNIIGAKSTCTIRQMYKMCAVVGLLSNPLGYHTSNEKLIILAAEIADKAIEEDVLFSIRQKEKDRVSTVIKQEE